jgi:hypothetical protein
MPGMGEALLFVLLPSFAATCVLMWLLGWLDD